MKKLDEITSWDLLALTGLLFTVVWSIGLFAGAAAKGFEWAGRYIFKI